MGTTHYHVANNGNRPACETERKAWTKARAMIARYRRAGWEVSENTHGNGWIARKPGNAIWLGVSRCSLAACKVQS